MLGGGFLRGNALKSDLLIYPRVQWGSDPFSNVGCAFRAGLEPHYMLCTLCLVATAIEEVSRGFYVEKSS